MADAVRAGEDDAVLCRQLRWKDMFLQREPDPRIPGTSDGFVWCAHSMNCLGPDGQVADRDTCRQGRTCFEGSETSP